MSVVIRLYGSGFVVQASDRMIAQDALEMVQMPHVDRQFMALAATILEPAFRDGGSQISFNFDDVLLSSFRDLRESRIRRPPGSSLRSAAEFFYSPKVVERIVNPTIAELQVEYCQALAEKRSVKAVWIRIRGTWSLFKALGLYAAAKNLAEIWKIARRK